MSTFIKEFRLSKAMEFDAALKRPEIFAVKKGGEPLTPDAVKALTVRELLALRTELLGNEVSFDTAGSEPNKSLAGFWWRGANVPYNRFDYVAPSASATQVLEQVYGLALAANSGY